MENQTPFVQNYTTIYDQRYTSHEDYWEFKPSSMALMILELFPPLGRSPKVLEVGSGEGGTAIFLARNGYDVSAFDLSKVGVRKTKDRAESAQLKLQVFEADINEFLPTSNFDIIFSSGTLQYLLPEKRQLFIESCQTKTNSNGLHVLHTFVKKPFISRAPDAEENENLWSSGELLAFYRDWHVENFIEVIKDCNSSGVLHRHAHNRLWARKV